MQGLKESRFGMIGDGCGCQQGVNGDEIAGRTWVEDDSIKDSIKGSVEDRIKDNIEHDSIEEDKDSVEHDSVGGKSGDGQLGLTLPKSEANC